MAQQYHAELEQLRKKVNTLENTLQDKEVAHIEIFESHKLYQADNKKYKFEIEEVQQQIKKMNQDRHRLKVDLAEQTERANDYEKLRDKSL